MVLILTEAVVRTRHDRVPLADTIVLDGSKIAFVGAREDWAATVGDAEIALGGRTIIPGMIDAHTHPAMVSRSSWHIRLPRTDDLGELLTFIADYAAAHPREEIPFLYFEYYDKSVFAGAQPTKELLDGIISDRPVLCQDFSEHEHWVNSRMLERQQCGARAPFGRRPRPPARADRHGHRRAGGLSAEVQRA